MTNPQTTENLQVAERKFKKARRNGPCSFIGQRIQESLLNKKNSNNEHLPTSSTIDDKMNYLENTGLEQSEWVPLNNNRDDLDDNIWACSDDHDVEDLECEQEDDLFVEKEGK